MHAVYVQPVIRICSIGPSTGAKGGSARMIEISKREAFYQQEYCGCIFSLRDTNKWRLSKGEERIQIGVKYYQNNAIASFKQRGAKTRQDQAPFSQKIHHTVNKRPSSCIKNKTLLQGSRHSCLEDKSRGQNMKDLTRKGLTCAVAGLLCALSFASTAAKTQATTNFRAWWNLVTAQAL